MAAMRPKPMAWPAGEVAQCPIGITTGPGGEELMLAGEVTPLTVIEMWYKPEASDAKVCGTVKLIWNNPGVTRPAKLGVMVVLPRFTVTPFSGVVETRVPAGDAASPVA